MKLYRVEHYWQGGISHSFEWVASKAKAKKLISAHHKEYDKDERGNDSKIDEYQFELTKAGVLRLLNSVASHPDNG